MATAQYDKTTAADAATEKLTQLLTERERCEKKIEDTKRRLIARKMKPTWLRWWGRSESAAKAIVERQVHDHDLPYFWEFQEPAHIKHNLRKAGSLLAMAESAKGDVTLDDVEVAFLFLPTISPPSNNRV